MNRTTIFKRFASLLLFSDLAHQAPCAAWLQVLRGIEQQASDEQLLLAYSQWFQALADRQQGWQEYLLEAILIADNPFTRQIQISEWDTLPSPMQAALRHDLDILQQIYQFDSEQFRQTLKDAVPDISLVSWCDQLASPTGKTPQTKTPQSQALAALRSQLADQADWTVVIPRLVDYYQQFGTGIFAKYYAVRWAAGQLQGVAEPDPIKLENLVGYDWQQRELIQNTEALLAGYPALNILLYGSRGSGKSSLIKALINQFGAAGLRLIEVSKASLGDLPEIIEQLRTCPQKFIIFVDDLSFEEDDDAFKALKVVLEGGVTARPDNVVVYATSNRRHLIREFYGDRPQPKDADEIHRWDTMQEKMSFSDRFGLTLTFEPAAQPTYLEIVQHLAQAAQLEISTADLEFRALQWATQQNGRSGRSARQFIDYLRADLALQRSATSH